MERHAAQPGPGMEDRHGSTRSSDSGIPVETFGSNTVSVKLLIYDPFLYFSLELDLSF